MMRRQRGLTTVEFAIVGPVALIVLIGCIEIGRMLFVWNTLVEATRRGARVAIVSSPLGTAGRDAVLEYAPGLKGLSATNVSVQYLTAAGVVTTTQSEMAFVRVSITGLTHSLLIPALVSGWSGTKNMTVPAFSTTLPVESLGYDPDP